MNSSVPDSDTLKALSKRHFGWHTDHFSRWWEYPWVARQLAPRPGQLILDAGAGKSPIPLYCAEQGARVVTVDNGSPKEPGEWGFFDYGSVGSTLTSRNEDFAQLPWADDAQFDLITSVSVVEHMPAEQRRTALREFARTIKAGGRLVLTIDLEQDRINLWNRCRGRLVDDAKSHGTLASMVLELEEVGFVLDEFTTCSLNEGTSRVAGLVLVREPSREPRAAKRAVPHSRSVLLGCVADDKPKYLAQAIRLAQSIRWFGGRLAEVDLMVCVVGDPAPAYVKALQELGATVRLVEATNGVHPPSNKLRFYDQDEVYDYDRTLLLDCDTVVLGDLSEHLSEPVFRAKIADLPTVPMPILSRVFEHFALPVPAADYRTTFLGVPTAWYCNSGVLALPGEMARTFVSVWRQYNHDLSERLELLTPNEFHCDQVSLALAFATHPVPFDPLPPEMNFPTHLANYPEPSGMQKLEPLVLHYHSDVDHCGFLVAPPYAAARSRVQMFNERLRQERGRSFDNRTFWDYRYAEHPDIGSGLGSRGELLDAKRELLAKIVAELKPASILDVGCGDGEVSADLAESGTYTGVDISRVVIEQNRERWPHREYYCGDFRDIEVEGELVICLDLLIHISDPDAYCELVNALVDRTGRVGIVSGYDRDPGEAPGMVFFHEPLGETLQSTGVHDLRRLGEYRGTALWIYEKSPVAADAPVPAEAMS